MKKIEYASLALFMAARAFALPTYTGPVDAEEFRVRGGIGHVMEKIRTGKHINIAYFGGSITEMNGWRILVNQWFVKKYPQCALAEIQAAIGGTGSDLGVYRYGSDVLSRKPDLVFVEFATNDAGVDPIDIWRNFDGIVRQTWNHDPEIDIVFVYTITQGMVADYSAGRCPRAASAMEMLADHYGIPSICFGPRVVADVKTGKLVMTIGEVETAVPVETPDRDQVIIDELAKEGRVLFSKDGTHPVMPGHEYYLESIKAAWTAMEGIAPVDHRETLSAAYYDPGLEAAKLMPIESSMLSGTWTQVEPPDPNATFSYRFGSKSWLTTTAGSKLKFTFRGTRCMIYDLLGPACGQVWITVDGVRKSSPVPRFDGYCTYYRLASLPVFSGKDGLHEVEIELDSKQPSRQAVAPRLANPEVELKSEKYNGTEWYAGAIMVAAHPQFTPEPVDGRQGRWFDANIVKYWTWPDDAALAEGGAWQGVSTELADAARLNVRGTLDVDTIGALSFNADKPKNLDSIIEATVVADVEFLDYSIDCLPEVDSNYKAAVLVVADGGSYFYYGLAKVGGRNEWVKLEGPAPANDGCGVKVKIVTKRTTDGTVVNYNIAGATYLYGGQGDIPVVRVGEISGAAFSGRGEVRSLFASVQKTNGGLVLVVR